MSVPKHKGGPGRREPPSEEIGRFETHHAFVAALPDLTPSGLAVPLLWFVLWDMCQGHTGLIYGASIARLAKLTGMAENTIRPALKVLRDEKFLTVEKDGKVPVYKLKHQPKAPPRLFGR